jgi:hypothetical protein
MLILALFMSSQLTGCFVATDDSDYEDDSHYSSSDEYESSDSYTDDYYSEQSEEVLYEEEVIDSSSAGTDDNSNDEDYEEYENYEEDYYEERESSSDESSAEEPSTSVIERHPSDSELGTLYLNEGFERPELAAGEYLAISQISSWSVDWSTEAGCREFGESATIEIQSEIDLGTQSEVEGLQHARLDGVCLDEIRPTRITTSLSGIRDAQTIKLYARSAHTSPNASLMIEWGDEIVMEEPLSNEWMEYIIDLTPGVLVDSIRVE